MIDDDFVESVRGVIGGDDGPQGDEIGSVVAVQIVTNVKESMSQSNCVPSAGSGMRSPHARWAEKKQMLKNPKHVTEVFILYPFRDGAARYVI